MPPQGAITPMSHAKTTTCARLIPATTRLVAAIPLLCAKTMTLALTTCASPTVDAVSPVLPLIAHCAIS